MSSVITAENYRYRCVHVIELIYKCIHCTVDQIRVLLAAEHDSDKSDSEYCSNLYKHFLEPSVNSSDITSHTQKLPVFAQVYAEYTCIEILCCEYTNIGEFLL